MEEAKLPSWALSVYNEGYLVAVLKNYLGSVSKVPVIQAQGLVFKFLESVALRVGNRQIP